MVIKPPLVAIVGPTASGKTELGIGLAEEHHGEIVSADSRQVYRGMDIGTNKPSAEEQQRIPHHLLDVADPKDVYTLAQFQEAAFKAIKHIQARGKLPFLVGGTGLYIQSIVDNLTIPPVPPQPQLRTELEQLPLEQLQQRLKDADPVGHAGIDLKNPRRVIRAIEVSETAGVPFSSLKSTGPAPYDISMIGIKRTPDELETRMRDGLDSWVERGLFQEVSRLHEDGVTWEQLESFGLEYRRVAESLQGKISREEAIELSYKDLLAYAKRQMTWFKRDSRIQWVMPAEADDVVSDWLLQRANLREAPEQ